MIRLIIDKLGSGHSDLFLKIDVIPEHVVIADSYFLFDFLEMSDKYLDNSNFQDNQALKFSVIEFLNYWIVRIKSIEKIKKSLSRLTLAINISEDL